MTARTFNFTVQSVTPPSTDAPEWVQTAINNGWQVGTWAAISGPSPSYGLSATNTLFSSAVPGESADSLSQAVIDSWTGAALCSGFSTHGCMFYGPTGNHNGVGARGDSFLFDLATRTWENVQPPIASYTDLGPYGEYPDGSPITNHTAWWPLYDSHRNEFVIPKGWGDRASGSDEYPKAYGHGFNLSAYLAAGRTYAPSQWRRYPQLPSLTSDEMSGLAAQCGAVWDESRKSFWFLGANNSLSQSGIVARYDSVADSWQKYAKQWCVFIYTSFGIDPLRDLLVIPSENYGVMVMQLGSPDARAGSGTEAFWRVPSTGSPPGAWYQLGFQWSTALGGFVTYSWTSSPSMVKLGTPSGGTQFGTGTANHNYSIAWSNLTTATAISPEAIRSNGANNKFRIARWGSQEVALFNARSDGAMYAFRLN